MITCIHRNLWGACEFCDYDFERTLTNEPAPAAVFEVIQENPFQWPVDGDGRPVDDEVSLRTSEDAA
jgi:hypothetical protein